MFAVSNSTQGGSFVFVAPETTFYLSDSAPATTSPLAALTIASTTMTCDQPSNLSMSSRYIPGIQRKDNDELIPRATAKLFPM